MPAPDQQAWAQAVRTIAVIGAGTMGEGIAQNFAEAGIEVRLIDIAAESLQRSALQIADNLAGAERAGLANEPAQAVLNRIVPVLSTEPAQHVRDCDMVIETVPEILELKQALFRELDQIPLQILIGSNTSSLTMSAICAGMHTQDRVAGLHYFNPAHIIPAVEIHRAEGTCDVTVARARAILERAGKVPFLVKKSLPGFVINRLTAALMREIYNLLEQDVISPHDLDDGIKASLGFRMAWMGPLESADFTGLDVGKRVVSGLLPQLSNRTEPPQALIDKVAAGDLGIKTGRGWLDYHGRTRNELLNERNARLMLQLKSFRQARAGA